MEKILVLMVMLSLFLFGCSQSWSAVPIEQQPQSTQPAPIVKEVQSQAQQPAANTSSPVAEKPQLVDDTTAEAGLDSKVKEFEMIASRFTFEPNVITVNVGDTVIFHLTSADVAHGLAIPEFGVNEEIPAKGSVNVEFIADQKGEFPFACSIPCGSGHRGMVGKVVVN